MAINTNSSGNLSRSFTLGFGYSFALWVKFNAVPSPGSNGTFFAPDNNGGRAIQLVYDANGGAVVSYSNGTGTANTIFDPGTEWAYYSAQVNTDGVGGVTYYCKRFKDSSWTVVTADGIGVGVTPNTLWIGKFSGGEQSNIQLDGIRIWKRIVPPSQLKAESRTLDPQNSQSLFSYADVRSTASVGKDRNASGTPWTVGGTFANGIAGPVCKTFARNLVGFGVTASGTNNFAVSIAVHNAVADALAITRTLSDSIAVHNAVADALAITRTLSDSIAAHNAVADALAVTRTLSDSITGHNAVADALAVTRTLSDNITGHSAVADALAVTRTLSDNITGHSAVVIALGGAIVSLAAAVAGRGSIVDAMIVLRSLVDGISAHNAVADALAITRTLSDSIAAHNAVADALAITRTLSDSITGHASFTDTLRVTRSLADNITVHNAVADAILVSRRLNLAVLARSSVLTSLNGGIVQLTAAINGRGSVVDALNVLRTIADNMVSHTNLVAAGAVIRSATLSVSPNNALDITTAIHRGLVSPVTTRASMLQLVSMGLQLELAIAARSSFGSTVSPATKGFPKARGPASNLTVLIGQVVDALNDMGLFIPVMVGKHYLAATAGAPSRILFVPEIGPGRVGPPQQMGYAASVTHSCDVFIRIANTTTDDTQRFDAAYKLSDIVIDLIQTAGTARVQWGTYHDSSPETTDELGQEIALTFTYRRDVDHNGQRWGLPAAADSTDDPTATPPPGVPASAIEVDANTIPKE